MLLPRTGREAHVEDTRFDQLTRGIRSGTSRRGLFGLLAGGLFVATDRPLTEAVRRRRRRKRAEDAGGADTGVEELPIPSAALTGGIWEETMEICHFDVETGEISRMAVPTTTLPNFLNSGDTLYIDCCTDNECGYLPFYVPTGCIQGACAYDADVGASCALGDGTTGVCDSDARCVTGYASAQAPEPSGYDPAPAGYTADPATGAYAAEPAAADYVGETAPEVYEGAEGEEVWYS